MTDEEIEEDEEIPKEAIQFIVKAIGYLFIAFGIVMGIIKLFFE